MRSKILKSFLALILLISFIPFSAPVEAASNLRFTTLMLVKVIPL